MKPSAKTVGRRAVARFAEGCLLQKCETYLGLPAEEDLDGNAEVVVLNDQSTCLSLNHRKTSVEGIACS